MTELQSETTKVIKHLEDQLANLKKENHNLETELYKVLEKDNQMSELKRETSKVINKLEDQLATLKKENSTLATELSRASNKDNQMSELQSETSNVMKQLEDQLARLRKENSTLATELSNVTEKDKQLTELCNQVENLTTQNKLLQDQAVESKKQFFDELKYPPEETSELGEDSMRTRRCRRSKGSDVKKLRKRVRQNEQELEFLGRFIRQRGLEFGRRPQYHIDQDLKDTPDELPNVKDTLNRGQ
ncbi:intracellular protein transport protein USO1-like [Orbicella faveolata]|uniref:intracellular protein transport protein USO1-like n=1 Tax=Orbicella faveolata TaxID=48498 RepID=UPI0009E54527|nr:intracellular protein transport protein USO1-like [Orbicella faveolata]